MKSLVANTGADMSALYNACARPNPLQNMRFQSLTFGEVDAEDIQARQPHALPARMLMAVPATTTMAINEMADWVIINILAARDNGAVSAGLKATLVV